MKKAISIEFWFYTAIVALTILNDKLSFMNMVFSLIYIPYCLFYAVKVVNHSRGALYIFTFTILYIIYVIISPDVPQSLTSKWGMLNWEAKVMLTFFPAYYFSKKGLISPKSMRYAGILFLGIATTSYFLNIKMVLLNIDVNEEGITNNVGYLFVCILPLLFTNIRKNIILIIITYIFILASLKRGAILCGLITIPLFITLCKDNLKINKNIVYLSIILAVITITFFIQKEINENLYVAKRLEQTLEGDSSGRDNIIITIWKVLETFDFGQLLFGRGINYSMKILGNFAHNDWLELLTSMGLLGAIFYLLTFIGMYTCCKRCCSLYYRRIGYLIILIALIRSLISMNYFSLDSIPLYYTLGLICYKSNKYAQNRRIYCYFQ